MERLSLETPVGDLTVSTRDGAIVGVDWLTGFDDASPLLEKAAVQIRAYFDGTLQVFDLPLNPDVSSFQQDVCDAMAQIPFGQTRTYGDLAQELGVSAQAVGRGCGGNPIPILIPCHRVMGANGKLVGFSGAGGVETKVALLRHEGAEGFLI